MNNKTLTPLLVFVCCLFSFWAQAKSDLLFIENVGQIHDQHGKARKDIDFVLQANGLTIFISRNKISYQFVKGNKMQRVDASLKASSASSKPRAEEKQVYYENHYHNSKLIGSAQSFKKIVYRNIYPHIDWVLKINNDNTFEYEYLIGALGDARQIKMEYKGANSIQLNKNGDLVIATPMGNITEQAPLTYTQSGQLLGSKYVLNKNILSYHIDPFAGALVIDPKVAWATYYGDTSNGSLTKYTNIQSINYSETGKIFVAGITSATKDIATIGAYQSTLLASDASKTDIFYVAMDSLGNRLYATYFGSAKSMSSARISVLKDTLYLAGNDASGMIATTGAQQTSFSPYLFSPFLAKFSPSGLLQWSTYCGGDSIGYLPFVTSDTLGNVFLSGGTKNPTKIATIGAFRTSLIDSIDAYLVKYNSFGKRIWGTYLGGKGNDLISGLTFISNDGTGAIYALGNTTSDTGIATPSAFKTTYSGKTDAMLLKFDTSGNRVWGTYFGGENGELPYCINQDGKKNIYISGSTSSTNQIASIDAYQKTLAGSSDAFIAKFNSGGSLLWSTYFGGDKLERPKAAAADTFGNIYLSGSTQSTAKIADSAAFQSKYGGGGFDGFIAGFTPEGKKFWSSYYGGEGNDDPTCSVSDGINLYIGGATNSVKGIATKGSFRDSNANVGNHGFILKIKEAQTGYKQPEEVSIRNVTLFNNKLYLFPNPNKGAFNFVASATPSEKIAIVITDLSGKICLSDIVNASLNGEIDHQIKMKDFASGLYILNCEIEKKKYSIKFQIE